jgi:hypothetical protein
VSKPLLDAILLLGQLLSGESQDVFQELSRWLVSDEVLNPILAIAKMSGPDQALASAVCALLLPGE